ncbi:MAG TPA: M23 family metallopeptidase [Longimicrobiales bacterium]
MANPYRVMGLIGAAGVVSWAVASCSGTPDPVATRARAPLLSALYARPVERVETRVLEPGETLDRLLGSAQITGTELANLLLALREHKSPRSLRPGVEVTVRRWVSDGTPRAVELRINADSTIRLERNADGWEGTVAVTPTTVDTVYLSGVIRDGRTLYEALVENDAADVPPAERAALVVELAEIYAYKLDFSHDIQPGDSYRVVYEREARPDGTARRRQVLVAELVSRGSSYPAVYFSPGDDRGGYYDLEGRSLRGLFRRYPVDYVRITSSFTWRRYHPVLGIYRAHLGTDFGAPPGTRVRATGDGTVIFAGRRGGYGNMIELRHPGGYTTRYAHLRGFARGIRRGRAVAQGQVIGYVGSTGLATGPHLHYELRKNGRPLNARTAKLPGAPPIPRDQRDDFEAVLGQRIVLLDRIQMPGTQLAGTTTREGPARVSGES